MGVKTNMRLAGWSSIGPGQKAKGGSVTKAAASIMPAQTTPGLRLSGLLRSATLLCLPQAISAAKVFSKD